VVVEEQVDFLTLVILGENPGMITNWARKQAIEEIEEYNKENN
jgi:hypothetical protein